MNENQKKLWKAISILILSCLFLGAVFLFYLAIAETIDTWKGSIIGKMAIPGIIMILFITVILVIANIFFSSILFWKKSIFFKVSLIPLGIIALSFMLPSCVMILPSYENIMFKRSCKLIQSKDFNQMQKLVLSKKNFPTIAILPKNEYVIVDTIVINLKKKTFGKIPLLGFIGLYYTNGDSTSFSTGEDLFTKFGINLTESEFNEMIRLMNNSKISDFKFNEKDKTSPMYMFVSTGLAGTRGIINNIDHNNIYWKLDSSSTKIRSLDSNYSYFRIQAHDF